MSFILSLEKSDGTRPGNSTVSNHRSALFSLYRDYRVAMPEELVVELKPHFKGLKREIAQAISAGEIDGQNGKKPIDFNLYATLCSHLLKSPGHDSVFARCLLILTWNLMCRISNGITICFSHIQWINDSMGIFFGHAKNDQEGGKVNHLRHIYANPLLPEVCPILSLGLYMLCFPDVLSGLKLFPGTSQDDRFRRMMTRIFSLPEFEHILPERGLTVEEIGTHSIRKGSATYASSGSTAAPSHTAVRLRAGWVGVGVEDRYLKYEAAGDQYVGRTVAGLPIHSAEFAILPPIFVDRENVGELVSVCFPNIADRMRMIGEQCVASLIYHWDFLQQNLLPNHAVRTTVFFRSSLGEVHRNAVVCRLSEPTDFMRPTGIPPHVNLMVNMLELQRATLQVIPAVEQVGERIVSRVVQELEDRALSSGTVTRDGLESMIDNCIRRSGIQDALEEIRNAAPLAGSQSFQQNQNEVQEEPVDNAMDVANGRQLYMWNGAFHHVPQDFDFPKATAAVAWEIWCCGDASKRWPPLKYLTELDMPTKNTRKRLSDFRFLMTKIEEKARERNLWTRDCSVAEAQHMFQEIGQGVITVNGRVEVNRLGQLTWRTVVKNMREANRPANRVGRRR